jgi:uncharacterized protein YbjT (DUF2867 family)
MQSRDWPGAFRNLRAVAAQMHRVTQAGFLHGLRDPIDNLAAIGMIHGMGIFGNALRTDLKIPMAATRDIGDYAAQRLLHLDFSGKQTRELLGERDLSMTEVTAVIAHGIGKPDLRYNQFPYCRRSSEIVVF